MHEDSRRACTRPCVNEAREPRVRGGLRGAPARQHGSLRVASARAQGGPEVPATVKRPPSVLRRPARDSTQADTRPGCRDVARCGRTAPHPQPRTSHCGATLGRGPPRTAEQLARPPSS